MTKKVPVSLYFDGTSFVAKLVKRVPGPNYKMAGDQIEAAFKFAFGVESTHKRGTTTWEKEGADPDRADIVAQRLSHFEEIMSVTYVPPPPKTAKAPESEGHDSAVEVLRERVRDLEMDIKDSKENIKKFHKQLTEEAEALEAQRLRRRQLLETIKALGG